MSVFAAAGCSSSGRNLGRAGRWFSTPARRRSRFSAGRARGASTTTCGRRSTGYARARTGHGTRGSFSCAATIAWIRRPALRLRGGEPVALRARPLFAPRPEFESFSDPDDWLEDRCLALPERDKTVREVFEAERASLVPQAGPFEDHRSASARTSTTCLVQFDNNRYSAEASAAGGPVEVRAYAERVEIWHECRKAGEHAHGFSRGGTVYDPLHYLPALRRKPGALRNGAPFKNWDLCLDSTHVGLSGVFPPVRFGVQDIRLFRGVHRRFLSLGYGDLVVRYFQPGQAWKACGQSLGRCLGVSVSGHGLPTSFPHFALGGAGPGMATSEPNHQFYSCDFFFKGDDHRPAVLRPSGLLGARGIRGIGGAPRG